MLRRQLLTSMLVATAGSVALARTVTAASGARFEAAGFAAAQAAGKPILVAVHADWCPTCTKQAPILSRLLADPSMKEMVVFTLDFDTQKVELPIVGARMQSTLVVYRGREEKGRSVGVTDEAALKELLAKAVG